MKYSEYARRLEETDDMDIDIDVEEYFNSFIYDFDRLRREAKCPACGNSMNTFTTEVPRENLCVGGFYCVKCDFIHKTSEFS